VFDGRIRKRVRQFFGTRRTGTAHIVSASRNVDNAA